MEIHKDDLASPESVLQCAEEYDFDAIRSYLESGGNTHIFNRSGMSLIAALLSGYYKYVFYNDPVELKLCADHEGDRDFEESHVNRFCEMPLNKRPHPILLQIEYLRSMGIGFNDVSWEEARKHCDDSPSVETPLMLAVCNRDYCMVKYLLENGANPDMRLYSDDLDWDGYEKWLLDDLDIAILHGHRGDARMNDLRIAALLMRYGCGKWPGGICIDVDHETHTIVGHDPDLLY